MREASLKIILAVAFLALLFGDALHPDLMIVGQDAWHYYMPIKAQLSMALSDPGQLLWDPSVDCGRPYLADPITQALYPGNLLFLLFSGPWAWKLFVLLHLGLAILGFMSLARSFDIEERGAFFGALLFIGSGAVLSHHWSPIWWVGIGLLPWAMSSTRELLHGPKFARWAVVKTASFVALMILGGSFEPLLAYIYYAAFEVCIKVWVERRALLKGRPGLGRWPIFVPYLLLGAAAVLSIAVTAVQLGPTFDFLAECDRRSGSHPGQVTRWSLVHWRLAELFIPNLFGGQGIGFYWLAIVDSSAHSSLPFLRGIYVGMPAVLLAFQGFLASPKKQRVILGLGLLVTFILAMGKFTPVFWIARYLAPGFSLFRYPEKITTIAMVFFSLLAARGFPALFADRKILRISGVVASLLLLGSLGYFWSQSTTLIASFEAQLTKLGQKADCNKIHTLIAESMTMALGVTVLFTGLLFVPLKKPKLKIIYAVIIVIFPLLDIAHTNRHLKLKQSLEVLRVPPDEWPKINPALSPRPRVATKQPCAFVRMVPQQVSALGLDSTDGYGSARLRNRVNFDESFGDAFEAKRLRCLGVSFTLERPRSLPEGYRETYSPSKVKIEPFIAPPRVRLLRRSIVASNKKEQTKVLRSQSFQSDFDLVTLSPKVKAQTFEAGSGSVIIEELSAARIRLRTQCDKKRYLLICDSYYPGWTATVDGKEVPIFEANVCFRALLLEPGEHVIEWRFWPPRLSLYLFISGLALLILIALTVLYWRSKPRAEVTAVDDQDAAGHVGGGSGDEEAERPL